MISLDQTKDLQLVPGRPYKTHVVGDVSAAPEVARQALELAQRFGDAVAAQDFGAAHALCATELRAKRSVEQLAADLREYDTKFGGLADGPAIAYEHDNISWLYADEPSRLLPDAEAKWPKEMPNSRKRAKVIGFMVTRRTPEGTCGRSIGLWVSEEAGGYRVAKFTQYDQ